MGLDEIKMNFNHTLSGPHDLLISQTDLNANVLYVDLNSNYYAVVSAQSTMMSENILISMVCMC